MPIAIRDVLKKACQFGRGHLVADNILVAIALIGIASTPSLGQPSSVFYAIGEPAAGPAAEGNSTKTSGDVRLYEVDSATLRVVRSISVERTVGNGERVWMTSGMLSGGRDEALLTDAALGQSTVLQVSTPALRVKAQMHMGDLKIRGVHCLDHIFVHPLTSLGYFSCQSGSGGGGFVILDPIKQTVVANFPEGPIVPRDWPHLSVLAPQFVYDQQSRDLFVVGGDAIALDQQNRPVGYIRGNDVAKLAGFDMSPLRIPSIQGSFPPKYSIDKLVVLPGGREVISMHKGKTPALVLYQLKTHTVLRTWIESQNVTNTATAAQSEGPKPVKQFAQFRCGPVPSSDGSRLFAVTGKDIANWDASTLQELGRFGAPDPPETGVEECLVPAPDGRGLWYFGKSGKIYRLDDHTGSLVDEVKLPFHCISLIREP
jgi:hypothetical protein